MTRADCAGSAGSQGFALILVLWFLLLIGAVATYLIVNARAETAIAHNIRAAASAEALADAGLAEAVFHLGDPRPADRWTADGTEHRLALAGGTVAVRITDETLKINPNRAPETLLAALFETIGAPRNAARKLGAAAADWVSPDAPARPLGAKLDQYRDAGRSYGPPNAAMESLDEMRLVLGMTPAIFKAALPYLTIYSENAEPRGEDAPPVIRRALALEPLEGGDMAEPDSQTPPPTAMDVPAAAILARIVAISIAARSKDGGLFIRDAVVKLDAGMGRGYSVLDWRRGTPVP